MRWRWELLQHGPQAPFSIEVGALTILTHTGGGESKESKQTKPLPRIYLFTVLLTWANLLVL